MSRCRGSVLVFVLVMLAAIGVLGATLSRFSSGRRLAAAEFHDGLCGPRLYPADWPDGIAPCEHRTRREKRVTDH